MPIAALIFLHVNVPPASACHEQTACYEPLHRGTSRARPPAPRPVGIREHIIEQQPTHVQPSLETASISGNASAINRRNTPRAYHVGWSIPKLHSED